MMLSVAAQRKTPYRDVSARISLSARPGGRVSYTQYEAHYARQCGKQVWYFILDRNFPTDPHPPESKEFRILQAAYLRRVRNYQRRHPPIHDTEALRAHLQHHGSAEGWPDVGSAGRAGPA